MRGMPLMLPEAYKRSPIGSAPSAKACWPIVNCSYQEQVDFPAGTQQFKADFLPLVGQK
jgi:hypothetical protein